MQKDNEYMTYFDKDLLEIRKTIIYNLQDRDVNTQSLINKLGTVEGKLIRAIFVLIGGSFGKIEKSKLINISAAMEILHLATLVHDDIIDESDLRRGKVTINATHGTKSALFMGDYLFSESYVLFSKCSSPQSIINVSETIKVICKSEINQFLTTYSLNSTIRDYLRRINGKCATLFSLSLSIGAYEGGADKKVIQALNKIGYYAGMAFQLIDDILDITTAKATLGKPSENDIKKGIYSLPVIYEIKEKNEELINALENNDLTNVLEILKNSQGLKKSKEIAEKFTYKALKLIDELPDNQEKLVLKVIVETMLNRSF